jgi:predicted transcriptional regulator of viral defense system
MPRIDGFQLRKRIPSEEFDYTLLSSVLASYSSVRRKINELLRSGVIERVKKGLYVFGQEFAQGPVVKETLANLIYGPSCVSLEYALAFHGLIPERVETVTSVTPKRDKEFKTPLGNFTYRYLKPERYPVGIDQVWIDDSHPVLMASPEKALADYLTLKRVPSMKNEAEARSFLEDDIRIDQSKFHLFNPTSLRKLNRTYRNKNIETMVELFEQENKTHE